MNKIVLIGDSITDSFPVDELLKNCGVINKGISGDNYEGVYGRLERDVISLKPDIVFVLIGTNDFAQGRSNEEIGGGIRRILQKIITSLPGVKLYAVSILPVRNLDNRPNERISDVNKSIAGTAERLGVIYFDLWSYMRDGEGKLKKEFTDDGLHLTYAAYELWAGLIKKEIGLSDSI